MTVITRFAPSPTGFLHIGGARTALFNYLFAKHHGGKYLLRIEDTDKERSTASAVEAIFNGLNWLGLEGDMQATLQSEQIERHKQVAELLANSGAAYYCYLTQDEITLLREKNKQDGTPFRSPWRDPNYEGSKTIEPVLRLRMPDKGETTISDLVQGEVSVANKQLDDLVLMRSDKTPTYMLVVVVDDHDMGITHILRGDDHLNNAFRQTKIYQALSWEIPIFGHIPLIHGPDGAKLSKRHGALGVDAYKKLGFQSEAMLNYLAKLGWSHGDDDFFSRQQAISWFDGKSIGKAPAKFDMQKLFSINGLWLKQQDLKNLQEQILLFHTSYSDKQISKDFSSRLEKLKPHLTERASIITDITDHIDYLIYDGTPEINEESKALINPESCEILKLFTQILDKLPSDPDSFQTFLDKWLEEKNIKMRALGLPLRVLLTGRKSAPAIFDLIQALGIEETRNRINQICI